MPKITNGLFHASIKRQVGTDTKHIYVSVLKPNMPHLTMLVSKVSEAILPNTEGNHIGAGEKMDNFIQAQKQVRFVINGGFNHYRKDFYAWPHQNFNVGDPVGLVKIREHLFEDYVSLRHYGFLVQEQKGEPWQIVERVSKNEKYILGCTPLLIFNHKPIKIPLELMEPINSINGINPPSILGHGLERHPRTAVGIKNGRLYFITIDGYHQEGCTLPELQQLGLDLKLESLLNLDGGGSSQFRLIDNQHHIIQNQVAPEDAGRVLGHVIAIFDSSLI